MASGRSSNMFYESKIKDPNPLLTLVKNPYTFGICAKETDFIVEVLEFNEEKRYLIFRKKINGSVGYVCVFERNSLTIGELRAIYGEYKSLVLKLTNNNFREVEMVIICKDADPEALDSIKEYNQNYSHRPQIRVILNEG